MTSPQQPQQAPTASGQVPLTIAVAGTSEFELGFELAGVKRYFPLTDLTAEEVFATLQQVTHDPTIGIVIVEEEALQGIPMADRLLLENCVKPVLVTLRREPGESGLLRRQIIRAIGIDLLAPKTHANGEQ